MNALDRNFMNVGKGSAAARFLGVGAAAALLSGCAAVGIASVKVDPSSPVAADVSRIAREAKAYPRFSDIPPPPKDLLAPSVYGERADEVKSARAQLEAGTAPGVWTLGGTQAFTARARRDAGPTGVTPGTAQTEAFANAIRKRATPPPPANP